MAGRGEELQQQRIAAARFETLTFVPLDRTLVDKALLTDAEIDWWNNYHTAVRAVLAPQLEGDDLAWLEEQCAPL